MMVTITGLTRVWLRGSEGGLTKGDDVRDYEGAGEILDNGCLEFREGKSGPLNYYPPGVWIRAIKS